MAAVKQRDVIDLTEEKEQFVPWTDEEIPLEYKCPISLQIMEDPALLCDGFYYERDCILKWLHSIRGLRSPMTNLPINEIVIHFYKSQALKKKIEQWKENKWMEYNIKNQPQKWTESNIKNANDIIEWFKSINIDITKYNITKMKQQFDREGINGLILKEMVDDDDNNHNNYNDFMKDLNSFGINNFADKRKIRKEIRKWK